MSLIGAAVLSTSRLFTTLTVALPDRVWVRATPVCRSLRPALLPKAEAATVTPTWAPSTTSAAAPAGARIRLDTLALSSWLKTTGPGSPDGEGPVSRRLPMAVGDTDTVPLASVITATAVA